MLSRRVAAVAGAVALASIWIGPGSSGQPALSPCAPPVARDPMPEGRGHAHTDPTQHRFQCRVTTLASLDLRSVVPEPSMFGELDLAGNLLAVATPFPQSGFVLLDVKDPQKPVVLSRYKDARCETRTDFDCGADVKLTPDGRRAFLALQRTASGGAERTRLQPGIVTVDISDPRKPRRSAFTLLRPVGVHMLAFHTIGTDGYVFARARGLGPKKDQPGAVIMKVLPSGALQPVSEVPTPGAHDVFVWDDPEDKKTYLALSGAQSGNLHFYDVTNPSLPKEEGRFRPGTEQRNNVWYMHNAWEFRYRDRRFTLTGPELYTSVGSLGLPPGHGGVAGPVWMLDTENHARPTVVGEWRNPGKHKAGTLVFSPHNTWYAGNGITWTAHYHGGVWVLDWREVLAGKAKRPKEIGYSTTTELRREFVQSDAREKFITAPEMLTRPSIWDVVAKDPVAFASDINGGLLVLRRQTGSQPRPSSPFGGSPAGGSNRILAPGFWIALWIAAALVALLVIFVLFRLRRGLRPGSAARSEDRR